MTDYLLLIDGSSLLSTQFYGNLPRQLLFAKTLEEKEQYFPKIMQTSDGFYTNAVYGFVRTLVKILKDQPPSHLAVAWDVSRDTFRRELYADYKGTRTETLEPLKDQFILCQFLLHQFGIVQFLDRRFEADDFCGTLASRFEGQIPVRILTKDNDYLQLVTERTNLWLMHSTAEKTEELYKKYRINRNEAGAPERCFPYTPELVEKEFGVKPENVNSLKGIQGDASDNIKGVPGVGEATARVLIGHYHTVDALYADIHGRDKAGLEELKRFWKEELGLKRSPLNYLIKTSGDEVELVGERSARLSEELATIKRDIPMGELALPDLRTHVDMGQAKRICGAFEFRTVDFSFADNYGGDAVAQAGGILQPYGFDRAMETGIFPEESGALFARLQRKAGAQEPEEADAPEPEFSCVEVAGQEEAERLFAGWKERNGLPGLGFAFRLERPAGEAGFSTGADGQMALALSQEETPERPAAADVQQAGGGSGSQPFHGLWIAEGIDRNWYFPAWDAGAAQWLGGKLQELFEARPDVVFSTFGWKGQLGAVEPKVYPNVADMGIAAYLLNPLEGDFTPAHAAKRFPHVGYSGDGSRDALIAVLTAGQFLPELAAQGMKELFDTVEMPLVVTLYDMEQRGIRVEREALREYGDELAVRMAALEKEIYRLAGEEFNINSPKQLGVLLFEKLRLPYGKKTKTGYSTSADVLERLRTEDPIVGLILDYRQVAKLKSTYADGMEVFIREDGRIHGRFHQTITATGRISSSDPNLQNIPIRVELGRRIRRAFVPEPGFVFLDADYSQIELRVLAHMSGDERLIEAYREAQDIHRITASQVFHTPFDEVTPQQRSNAKAVNFGIVYGISSFGLGQGLNISKKEAEEYINQYFATYPGVKKYMDELVEQGREEGYVSTLFGRRRPIPEFESANYMQRQFGERVAMNSPIQGTAADIIKIAMVRVNESLKKKRLKSRLLLQIHDELLVETALDEVDEVRAVMEEEMRHAAALKVPLEVDVNQGVSWYEAK